MYNFENRERNKTITIRLSDQELDKLNLMIESSGEKFKSDFIRKLILNEEVKVKENFEFKKIDDKIDEILKNQTLEEDICGIVFHQKDLKHVRKGSKDYLEINLRVRIELWVKRNF